MTYTINVLNLCETLDAMAVRADTVDEQDTLDHAASSLRHYYLLSKRLETRIKELEKNDG